MTPDAHGRNPHRGVGADIVKAVRGLREMPPEPFIMPKALFSRMRCARKSV